jgi:integrase
MLHDALGLGLPFSHSASPVDRKFSPGDPRRLPPTRTLKSCDDLCATSGKPGFAPARSHPGLGVAAFVGRPMGPGDPGQTTSPTGSTSWPWPRTSGRSAGRPIGPHQIRHLIGSTLLDAGYGVHEVAERLVHDPATLMRHYTQVSAGPGADPADRVAIVVDVERCVTIGVCCFDWPTSV